MNSSEEHGNLEEIPESPEGPLFKAEEVTDRLKEQHNSEEETSCPARGYHRATRDAEEPLTCYDCGITREKTNLPYRID